MSWNSFVSVGSLCRMLVRMIFVIGWEVFLQCQFDLGVDT